MNVNRSRNGAVLLGILLGVGCGGTIDLNKLKRNEGAGSSSSSVAGGPSASGASGSGDSGASGDSGDSGASGSRDSGAGGLINRPSGGSGGRLVEVGGSGGTQPACEGGLRVLRTLSANQVVVWPEQQRVAFRTAAGTIQIHDVSAVAEGGEFQSVAELSHQTFGLTNGWNLGLPLKYGDGLLVTANDATQIRVFAWHAGTAATELGVSLPRGSELSVADPEGGLAFVTKGELYRAIERAETWEIGARIGASGQGRTALAFDGDDLLVGLEESQRDYQGEAGAAGEAGGWSARLERWSSANELVTSYPAVGNPRVATPADGGWLIGETNSFWGSYQAALEWLPPAKDALRTLTHVRVHSAGDSEDGAFGVAISGDRLFVANCESGLMSGKWPGNTVQLTPLGKEPEVSFCDPRSVSAIGKLLVLTGQQLDFALLCGE